MNKKDLIRCVNLKNNQVRLFPKSICQSLWWQKNTGFIPQEVEKIDSIIEATSEVTAENVTNEIAVEEIKNEIPIKVKRKYTKKQKSNGN